MTENTENSNIEEEIILSVEEVDKDKYRRFDHFLADKLSHLSRSFIKTLFLDRRIDWAEESEEGKNAKLELKKMPPAGSRICVQVPPPIPSDAQPENLPLEILYEDEYLVFLNKPAGMVVHPAPGNYTGTLVNALLYHFKNLSTVGDPARPGIVHRLDKGTSGVMVVAKTRQCHEALVNLFSKRDINRIYNALAMGHINPKVGVIEGSIGRDPRNRLKMAVNVRNGRSAATNYRVLESYKKMSLLHLKLQTGRTHQIRVHLSKVLRSSVLCDPLYGNPTEHIKRIGDNFSKHLSSYPHPLLYAKTLGLVHPITKQELYFEVDPPEIFQQVVEIARSEMEGS
jgi:23S rRNA pseudouridine1911/1915/1917 synthase